MEGYVMKSHLALQDADTKQYWYGYYSNKQWTDNLREARTFGNKAELKDWLKTNEAPMEDRVLIVVTVYGL